MNHITRLEPDTLASPRLGQIVSGVTHTIGEGFTALHFSEDMFATRMDPLLMVDHFVMTAPTFAPHLHAGISAVTVMFEDSEGNLLNRDTLGHNLALKAGDLYWLAAASGAVHEEVPEANARTHALQVFVNLPSHLKLTPARTLHVPAQQVPIIQAPGHRVRVVLGRSGDVIGAEGTPEPLTLLDGSLQADGVFAHTLAEGFQAWIYAVSGTLTVHCNAEEQSIPAGHSTTVSAGAQVELRMTSSEPCHFVLIAGSPIGEPFIKYGPLVMTTEEDIRRTLVKYAKGGFGQIPS
ncbi:MULTISPECIES: pirin family protein [Pseudomonas]|uniref:Pirin family protein n=1 Tax=Pseudomonas gessardii TaxID=78544 RepID=A0A7Y1QN40_9PSED|nr:MULTISPECIES: pirin-like C-terminal cupin domain-containing protein [Pseudomonas]MBH3425484.1 pirin family protein [Pseudomonas gessardii]MCF4979414.1 pirin family protein [Pseudomonas gessardii]MCF4990235.1 pirin family protein [Pseudomonas gessardii]MCF5087225.1 pirin family protein [Pseudomonas gessardii]MCF5094165.1 pirin family protein [Pseudomonas gessardii]